MFLESRSRKEKTNYLPAHKTTSGNVPGFCESVAKFVCLGAIRFKNMTPLKCCHGPWSQTYLLLSKYIDFHGGSERFQGQLYDSRGSWSFHLSRKAKENTHEKFTNLLFGLSKWTGDERGESV